MVQKFFLLQVNDTLIQNFFLWLILSINKKFYISLIHVEICLVYKDYKIEVKDYAFVF